MAHLGGQAKPSWNERIQSWSPLASTAAVGTARHAGYASAAKPVVVKPRFPNGYTGAVGSEQNVGAGSVTGFALNQPVPLDQSKDGGETYGESQKVAESIPPVHSPIFQQRHDVSGGWINPQSAGTLLQGGRIPPVHTNNPHDFKESWIKKEMRWQEKRETFMERLEIKKKEEAEAQSQPPPACVESVRFFLEKARKKQPTTFALPMTISDLQRLMRALGERFRMDELADMAKDLGYETPNDVIRRHCADLVKLETQEDKEVWRKEVAEIEEAGVDIEMNKRIANEERFYARLPVDELSYAENMLRKFLFRWMARRREEDPEDPLLLEDALEDKHVKELMDGLSIKKYDVTLMSWLERRVQKDYDIGFGLDSDDRYMFLTNDAERLYQQHIEESSRKSIIVGETRKVEGFQKGDGFMSTLPEQLSNAEIRFAKKLQRFSGVALSAVEAQVKEDVFQFIRELYDKRKLDAKKAARRFPFERWIKERIGEYILLEGEDDNPVLKKVSGGRGKHGKSKQPTPALSEGRGQKRLLPYEQSRLLRAQAEKAKSNEVEKEE